MKAPKINIIIVDDNRTFLKSVEFFLNKNENYTVINKAYDGEDLLNMEDIHNADIILMDIDMPKMDGITATKNILKANNDIKVIALTNYDEKAYLYSLVVNGFKGCVYKKNTFDQLDNAILKVMNGGMFFPQNMATS